MVFFTQSITVLQTLLVAIGAGLGLWGLVNLLEGYGQDNPASKSQGIKQLMAGGGIVVIAVTLVPLLSNLFAAGGGGVASNDTIRVAFILRPSLWPVTAQASGGSVPFAVIPQDAFLTSIRDAAGATESVSFSIRSLSEISSTASRAFASFPQGTDVLKAAAQLFVV